MPFFGRANDTATTKTKTTHTTVEKPQRNSIFGSRTTAAPVATTTTTSHHHNGTGAKTGLLHRDREDTSITSARDQVMQAEGAERDADRALAQARTAEREANRMLAQARVAVKEAKEQAKRVEREAAEEARLAMIKQKEAQSISRRAQPLGRHDR